MKILKQLKNSVLNKKYYFVISAIGLMLIAGFITSFILSDSAPSNSISDEARMNDLYIIEQALNKSINDQTSSERKMPSSLNELNIARLQGKLKDYEYKDYETTYHGGSYTLCAHFSNQGEKNPEDYFTYAEGTQSYRFHNKGSACFENSVYKGGSHIKPL